MFEMMFSDGISRGMAHDAADHPRVCVTKSGSSLTAKDWVKLKPSTRRRLVGDDLPPSPRVPETPTSDEVDDLDAFREHLRSRGLDEESIKQACDLVHWQRGRLVKDQLPVAGPGGLGGYRSGLSRQPGEKVFPYATDIGTVRPRALARFAEMFPDAARLQTGGGYSQFDADHARLTERRPLAADAAPARSKKELKKLFGKGLTRVGIGPFPPRVW
jgi:hypothetical protein